MDKLEIIIDEQINSKIEICSENIFIHIKSHSLDLSFRGNHHKQNIIIDNLILYVRKSNSIVLDLYSYSTHKFDIYKKITEFLIIENLTISAYDEEDMLYWLNYLNTICCVKNLIIKLSSKSYYYYIQLIINICIKFLENDTIKFIKIEHTPNQEILEQCSLEFNNFIDFELSGDMLILSKLADKV